MRKLYQSEWFGIPFASFAKLSAFRIADHMFYERFYHEFFKRYADYASLPESYRKDKAVIAEHIADLCGDARRIVSIGCGNGFIESLLAKTWSGTDRSLVAYEPSPAATRLLESNRCLRIIHDYFPGKDRERATFEVAYSSAVDYVFTQKELVTFLKTVRSSSPGMFVLYSASFDDRENSVWASVKNLLHPFAAAAGITSPVQFWGYLRSREDYRSAFVEAGYSHVLDGTLRNGTYFIRGASQ